MSSVTCLVSPALKGWIKETSELFPKWKFGKSKAHTGKIPTIIITMANDSDIALAAACVTPDQDYTKLTVPDAAAAYGFDEKATMTNGNGSRESDKNVTVANGANGIADHESDKGTALTNGNATDMTLTNGTVANGNVDNGAPNIKDEHVTVKEEMQSPVSTSKLEATAAPFYPATILFPHQLDSDTDSQATETASGNKASVFIKQEQADNCSILSAATTVDDFHNITSTTIDNETMEKLPVTKYHIDADLYLKVLDKTGSPVLLKVYSALLAGASKEWNTIIYKSAFRRSQHGKDGKWIIEVFDDDAYGLDVILSIAHYKFHNVPQRPNVNELYGLARMIQKYDCSQLVVPFMEAWMGSLTFNVGMSLNSATNHDEELLYVAWVLGEGRCFARAVYNVAYNSTINESGDLVDSQGRLWKDQGFPGSVIELLAATRAEAVVKILAALDRPFQELMGATQNQEIKFCHASDANMDTKQQCQFQQLGSLICGLTAAALYPAPAADQYKGTVFDLADKVVKIKVAHFKAPGVKPHQDFHRGCGIGHTAAVEEAKRDKVQLGEGMIKELVLRAKKSGAYRDSLFAELVETEGLSYVPEIDLQSDAYHYKQTEVFEM